MALRFVRYFLCLFAMATLRIYHLPFRRFYAVHHRSLLCLRFVLAPESCATVDSLLCPVAKDARALRQLQEGQVLPLLAGATGGRQDEAGIREHCGKAIA